MPFLEIFGYLFGFYSSDGNEPPHVHVRRRSQDKAQAKIWLNPVRLEESNHRHFKLSELRKIVAIVRELEDEFFEKWQEHFKNDSEG